MGPESVAAETEQLEDCLRSLVSILALPSICHGRSLHEILTLSIDALRVVVPVDVAYGRLAPPHDDIEVCRGVEAADLASLRERIEQHRALDIVSVRELFVPIGYYAEAGILYLRAARDGFPSRAESVVTRAAASLTSAALEAARTRISLEAARTEAELASRAKDDFLALLGHELRNPLAPIETALHLMKLRAGGVVAREREIVERQVKHLTRLVDDLLDVSRITRGKIELQRAPVEMAEIVAKAVETATPLIERRRHRLTVSVRESGLVVDGDVARLAQVVANLLTNAAKYTEPGGQISVDAVPEGDVHLLRVRDSGIGISTEMLPKIFDMFVQEPQALDRSHGGLGLGLTLVRSLVWLHGGTVEVTSEGRGRGAQFTIRLPRSTQAAPVAESPQPVAAAASFAGRPRILVVDDNVDAALLLSEALELFGCDTTVVHDGMAALAAAADVKPTVVLLDIGLPVMDGYEVASRLRQTPGLEAVRIVAVTGYGQKSDIDRSKEAGFDAHLVKPVLIDEVHRLIETFVAQR